MVRAVSQIVVTLGLAWLGFGYWSLSAYLKVKVKNALQFIENFEAAVADEARRRGVDGGYQLALAPDSITIADIIRAIDGPLANIAGAKPEDLEYRGAAAALRDTWVALRATMRSVLEVVTLAHLVSGQLPESVTGFTAAEDAWRARV